jgi:hypothetical protein
MKGRSGREYVLFLKSPYISKVTLLTWLFPSPTIAGSCAVTLIFAVLLTLPLRRLRMAPNCLREFRRPCAPAASHDPFRQGNNRR